MDPLSQIRIKYEKQYFGFKDKIKKGTKVVYMPSHGCFVYFYHDNGYIRDRFKPGDSMTVKRMEKSDHPPYVVYVDENEGVFSPNELLPAEIVDKDDIKKAVTFFNEYAKAHKLSQISW